MHRFRNIRCALPARMRLFATLAAATMIAALTVGPATAASLDVKVQIPALTTAEYHRPYVAIWIEREDQTIASQLAVWYQTDKKREDGAQWLKDLRQWWRRGGRGETLPIDGVTGATRPVGEHTLQFKGSGKQLSMLAPGTYNLTVEAVREAGGRELLRVPFAWPAKQQQHLTVQGKTELGAIAVDVAP